MSHVSTWHPCVFQVFKKLPCKNGKKKLLQILCQVFPKEIDKLVAGQLDINA